MQTQSLTIRRPDDWHLHLRDGEMLRAVAPHSARQFARNVGHALIERRDRTLVSLAAA